VITVHHLENSRSQRVLWLLEELGRPYEITHYKRDPKTMLAPPELRAIHPLGKAPVVTDDGSGETLVLAESGAILEHLAETYGDGTLTPPRGTAAHRDFRYWLHYAEGSAMSPLLLKLVMVRVGAKAPLLVRPIARAIANKVQADFVDPQIALHMDHWERSLADHEHFAGAFSAADIQMSFPVEAAMARAARSGRFPRLQAWLDRVHGRPAYQRALERGGPYALLS
jgi:glutathione S-transferase